MSEADGGSEGSTPAVTPLSDVFDNTSSEPASHDASADEKDDEKTEEKASQKLPESVSSSDDDKSKSDEQKGKPEEKPAEKKAEKPEISKAKEGDKPSDEKKAEQWESEENTYKKRFQDTSANWNKEHQEKLQLQQAVAQLQQESTVLRKIADGTYDPEKDDPRASITPETIATQALRAGKTLASHNAAVEAFGAETVEADLAEFHNLFGNNSQVQALVLNHDSPVYEARRIMDRVRFEKQYGSTPTDWKKNIRAEVEKELKDSMRKELTEEIMGRVDKKKGHPAFSSSRGSNGMGKDAKPNSNGPVPLKKLFG